MSIFSPAWPYAVKAVIQHEFDIDHLNLWLTFRFAMDQDVKPTHDLWTAHLDDVEFPIATSAWQDAYTLLLTVAEVGALPDRVLLQYDGPSQGLRATWEKQWEPWGPILSLDITT